MSIAAMFSELNPFHGDNQHYTKKDVKQGYYEYIPSNLSLAPAVDLFTRIRGRKPKTFLDLGSGKGGMLVKAAELGMDATGVEYLPRYIDLFNEIKTLPMLEKLDRAMVTVPGDILEWVPPTKYDIIYFFRPLQDGNLFVKFLRHMMTYLPRNQFLVHPGFTTCYKDMGNSPESKAAAEFFALKIPYWSAGRKKSTPLWMQGSGYHSLWKPTKHIQKRFTDLCKTVSRG